METSIADRVRAYLNAEPAGDITKGWSGLPEEEQIAVSEPKPICIENCLMGHTFAMIISPRAHPAMVSYCCQINDVEVPGPVFELALRLAMGGSW